MSRESSNDPKFLGELKVWLENQAEVLLLIRRSHAAGAKDFEFFSSFQDISERIRQLPPRTSVIGFRQPQLPIRGVVSDDFIAECLSRIPEGAEYLVVELTCRAYGRVSFFRNRSGESRLQLRDDLEDSRGVSVAVGLYPPWLHDTDEVISAIVPDEHGAVSPGIY